MKRFAILITILLLITSCSTEPSPVDTESAKEAAANTPLPTSTPVPTATSEPTDTPQPTETPIPTDTPEPTASPVDDYTENFGRFFELTAEHLGVMFEADPPSDKHMSNLDEHLEELRVISEELINPADLPTELDDFTSEVQETVEICMEANELLHDLAEERHESGGSLLSGDFNLMTDSIKASSACNESTEQLKSLMDVLALLLSDE